jgi:stage V sporulation protein B
MQKSMRFLFMLLLPMVTLLSVFAQSVIRFFYGEDYSTAVSPMQVLTFGMGFLTIFYILAFVLNGAGKNKFPMWIALYGAILNSVLNYIFIQREGLMGAALATTVTSFIIMLFATYFTSKKIASFFEAISILKYLLASGIIYWLATSFFSQDRFLFILWSAILLVVYFFLLFALREIKAKDAHLLLSMIKKQK